MFYRKIIVISFFLLLQQYQFSIIAQNTFYSVDYTQGLTNLFIIDIVQDKDGFIWIGTEDGLFRYDGYKFKAFQSQDGNPSSLSNNYINCLMIDSNNKLWIATKKGLNIYDPEQENFKQILADENNPHSFPNNLAQEIYQSHNGTLWFGNYDGLSRLINPEAESKDYIFENIRFVDTSDVRNWIYSICEDQSGNIWCVASYNGVYKIDKDNRSVKNYYTRALMPKYFKTYKAFIDKQENINVTSFTEGFLYQYDKENDSFKKTTYTNGKEIKGVYDVIYDENNHIWLASSQGIWHQKNKNEEPICFKHNALNPGTISSNDARCIFRDNKNALWIGTRGKGIDYYAESSIDIEILNKNTTPSLTENMVTGMFWINNSLYIASQDGGTYLYSHGKFEKVMSAGNSPIMLYDGKRIFSERDYYDFSKKQYNRIFEEIKHVSGMTVGKNNQLNLLTYDDFIRFNYNDLNIEKRIPIDDTLKKRKTIKMVCLDTNRFLLLGNFSLNEFYYPSGKHKKIWDGKDLEGNMYGFKDMYLDEKTCWIISDRTLYEYNLENGLQNIYNLNLSWGDKIYSLSIDNDQDIWLTTNKGIVLLNTKNETSYLFNELDGVVSTAFSRAIAVSPENKVYVGTGDGIIILNKNSFKPNKNIPQVVFTGFHLFNKEVHIGEKQQEDKEFFLSKSINEMEEINLNYKQNFFTIEFAALNYTLSSKNQYKFYLEGLEEKWNLAGNNRTAFYNGLAPGKYTFHVQGSNNDGLWNEHARTLNITIHPPFWTTLWFRMLLILIAFLIVVLIFTIRMRAEKKKKELLENLVRQRTVEIVAQKEEIETQAENLQQINILLREHQDEMQSQAEKIHNTNQELLQLNHTKDKFFNIIAHDLRNPFQAIDGYAHLLLTRHNKLKQEKILDFIRNIKLSARTASDLLGNLMEWAMTQTNRIDFKPKKVSLSDVAAETFDLLKTNAENKEIQLLNNVPDNLFAFADKNMVDTIIRNLVNNAIKFTPEKGKITLSGSISGNYALISIEDTGVGMSEKTLSGLFRIDHQTSTSGTSGEEGTGLGLLVCKEFIDRHNGNIKVESKLNSGSRFTIHLPTNNEQISNQQESDNKSMKQMHLSTNTNVEMQLNSESGTKDEPPILLIVEDNADIRKGIVSFLSADYKIIEAGDGMEGLQYALDIVPDIIISDWMMPKMDGIELTRMLKSDNRTSHIPIIMLTARSTPKNKIEGFETGADEYMTKPFDFNVLKVRLSNLIKQRKALQKLFSSSTIPDSEDFENNSGLSDLDDKFMNNFHEVILKNLDNSEFSINENEKEIGMSRAQIYRKIKALTGLSPVVYLRNFRLQKAAELLRNGKLTVSEVMYSVGFNNVSYFARSFKEMFGCTPKEYPKGMS